MRLVLDTLDVVQLLMKLLVFFDGGVVLVLLGEELLCSASCELACGLEHV